MSRKRRNTVYLILLASLVFRLAFLSGNVEELTRGPLYDDSFYCFQIARNIADGHGSTFDRLHATNGYQPLWVGALVPLYWLSGENDTLPIYLALILSALLNVFAGWILYRLAARYVSWEAGVFALVLWGFGPAIVRQSINGLETSLAIATLAVALEYYLTVFRSAAHPTRRQSLTLGVLLGLAMLARVDAALFVGALAIDRLWGRRQRALRSLAHAALACFMVVLPWLLISQALVGSIFPESGRATRFLSQAYAPHDVAPHTSTETLVGSEITLFLDNVGRSFLLLGTSPGVHVFTRSLERIAAAANIERGPTLYAIAAFLVLLVFLMVYLAVRGKQDRHRPLPSVNFLFGYSVLLMAAYSLVVFGQIFYNRYYYPVFFFSIFLGAIAFDVFLKIVAPVSSRLRSITAVCIILVYLGLLPWMSLNRLKHENYEFVNAVAWIRDNTLESDRIGVFNSGAIGYFSDRRVVNLDGKVNPSALAALERGELRRYLAEEGIDYVLDHNWILKRFLDPPKVQEPVSFVAVADSRGLGVKGWRAYRVGVMTDTALIPASDNSQVSR